MSNESGSCPSSTRSEVEVKCHHQIDSKLRMIRNGSNLGKKFYGCSLWLISEQNQGKIYLGIFRVKLKAKLGQK